MSTQTLLQNLKPIKQITTQTPHRKIADLIISSATGTTTTLPSVLSTLTLNTVKLILSDPYIKTHKCISLFHVITQNQTLIPFKIEIEHYTTVIYRAIHSKRLEDAKNILYLLSNEEHFTVSQSQPFHSRIISKMFNLLLKVYSDTDKFDAFLETFDYMRNNGIEIDKWVCSVYLIRLIRSEKLGFCLGFMYKMMESGVCVSVYTLTVVVDGLCKNGEVKSGRELVESAMLKSVEANVVTFNMLVDACCKRWDFEELDLVLVLMEKGGVEFNLETYKFLINGFLSSGKIGDAVRMIVEMHDKGLRVEIYLWNTIVRKYCELGKMESAFQAFDKMVERGVNPNGETYVILVSGICRIGEMDAAKELVDMLQRKGIDLGRDVFVDLIDGWCKKGEFDDAVGVLLTMEKKGLFGYACLYDMVIAGLCELNRVEEATRLLSFVVKRGATAIPDFFINLVKDPK